MAIDPTISLQAKAPDGVTSLRDMMNLRATALSLQKQRATMAADIAQRQAESRNAQTNADINAQTAPAQISQAQAQADTANTGAQSARVDLNDKQTQIGLRTLSGLYSDPDFQKGNLNGMLPKIDQAEQLAISSGASPEHIKQIFDNVRASAQKDPHSAKQSLANYLTQAINASGQAQLVQPNGIQIDNGQQSAVVNTNPLAALPVGSAIPGTGVQKQIPVGAPVYDPNKRAMVLTGPGGGSGPQAAPALGEVQAAEGEVAPVTQDWAATTAAAKQATPTITVLSKIKQHAKGAILGYANDKRALINSIGDAVGMSTAEMAKTDTDLLAKNANMLALAGGDTNLAKSLAETTNPNGHMNLEGINEAADQIIGQQKLALAKQQYMQRFTKDPAQYTQELTKFNQVGDPQVFEFASKDPDEQKQMLSKMSVKERQQLSQKMKQLHMMGINP